MIVHVMTNVDVLANEIKTKNSFYDKCKKIVERERESLEDKMHTQKELAQSMTMLTR